jgi:hypothetical protein
MIVCNRRAATVVALFALTAALVGCGDSEADQRNAFIKFLDDINQRVGVHFLVPTQEDRVAFGDYRRHYTVILDFNKDMQVISNGYKEGLIKIGIGPNNRQQTLEQMVARRQDFPRLKEATVKTMQAYESRLAKVNAERGALQQPDDLKAAYNKAFDKLVAAPTQAMITADKALLDMLDCSVRLAEYINEHRTQVTVSGSQIRANDANTLAEINALIKAHQEAQKRFQDAQRAAERVNTGR